ncbi:MAG: histidinol-phosphate transaminase [Chloroflexi bacterium]|nr:histidinol-phosphate transaminase [Chloroflexota bacterium]
MSLIRPNVDSLEPYVPGEQPQEPGWIKLNTNENPFMAPQIAVAVAEAATDLLRLYPDPLCVALREKLAARYGLPAAQIICGNGSDELLTLAVRATAGEGDRIAFPTPSYSLYDTLARIQNAFPVPVELGPRWELPVDELGAVGAALTLVANPNAPTGTPYSLDALDALARAVEGLLLVDEAYVDFGGETALPLVNRHENVLVLRTMSKAFGLAGVRLGYAFGSPRVIEALNKIKDSYNVDRLTQVAGIAALDAYDAAMAHNRETAARRDRLAEILHTRFGFRVWPSATNFLLVDTGRYPVKALYEALKRHRILVRYFDRPLIGNCLRITIGSEPEVSALLRALESLLL